MFGTFVIEADVRWEFGWHFIECVVAVGSFDLVPSGEVCLRVWDFFDRTELIGLLRVFVVLC